MGMGSKEPWHWRQAMQLATQLPPEEQDGWIVLDCLEQLFALAYARPDPPDDPDCQVLRFPGESSPSRRASSKDSASFRPK
jgi:hypothetical protein